MSIFDARDRFAIEMKLPLSARFRHSLQEIAWAENTVREQRPHYSSDEVKGLALARLDALKHIQAPKKPLIPLTKDHNWRRKAEIAAFVLALLLMLFFATRSHAQNVVVRGQAKGSTSANNATVQATDANHNSLDVNCTNCTSASGGTSSTFGAAFPATGTAIGASDGVNMQSLVVDASKFLKVNCAVGCSGSSFADASAFTFATTAISLMGAVVDDVATNSVAENSAGAPRMSGSRILYIDLSKTAANTNKLLVTPDSVALPANQSVNVSQINAVTPLMGNGTTGTGSLRVTVASDNTAFSVNATDAATSATGSAVPAKAAYIGGAGSGSTGGNLIGIPVGDTYKNINISTATTTLLVTGVASRQVRISALHMITALANNVALIEGTGATCGTGTAGMAGGTTAASGYNLAANGGIAFGSGVGTVMQTATTGDSICAVTSAATQLSGGLQYTIY